MSGRQPFSHDPPCPLAPHHTHAARSGAEVSLRVLFAADPDDEARVRSLVDEVLARGTGNSPAGARTTWRLVRSGPSELRRDEAEHAARLIRS